MLKYVAVHCSVMGAGIDFIVASMASLLVTIDDFTSMSEDDYSCVDSAKILIASTRSRALHLFISLLWHFAIGTYTHKIEMEQKLKCMKMIAQ